MATTWITYETGTLGATVAAPDSVLNAGSGTVVYDNTHVLNGTKSMKMIPTASSACYTRIVTGLNSATLGVTVGFWFDTIGVADEEILRLEDSAGTPAKMITLTRAGSGKLSMTDKNSTSPRLWIGTANPPTGQWIICKLWIQINATTGTAGSVKFAFYNADGSVLGTSAGGIDSPFISSSSNLGTVTVNRIEIGRTGTQTNTDTRWYDTIGYDAAATDLLANYATDRPPVANAGSNQTVTAGKTVTLDGTGSSDPDGDTISYLWTQTGGTSATLSSTTAAQPTFTAPASTSSQSLTFQLTVSDGSLTDTDTVVITVSAYVPGSYSSGSTSWTTYEGGTVGAAMVNGTDGEAFVVATGTSYAYASEHVFVGAKSMKIIPGASQQAAVRHKSGMNTTHLAVNVPVWYDNAAIIEEDIFRIHDTASAKIIAVSRHGSGKLTVTDQTSSSPRLWLATGTLPTAQWIVLKLFIQIGGTASTGTVKLAAFDTSGNLLFGLYTQTATLGTVNIDQLWLGRVGTQGSTDARWYDTIGYDPTATDNLANYVTVQPPVANAGPDQNNIAPGATVTLNGTGSTDPAGSTLTYAWAQTGGTSVTLSSTTAAQPTFTAPTGSSSAALTFQLTVSNGTVASTPDTVVINVGAYVPGGYASANTVWITYEDGVLGAAMVNGVDGEAFLTSGGTTYTYANEHLHAGAKSMKIVPASGQQAGLRLKSALNTNKLAITVPVWYDSLESVAEEDIFSIHDTANAKVLSMSRHNEGKLTVTDKNNASPRLYIAATTPPVSAWLICKVWLQLGDVATDGQVKMAVYDRTGNLLYSFASAAANLGTLNLDQLWLGRLATTGMNDARWYDDVGYDPTATDLLANMQVAPDAGSDQNNVEPYSTITLDGSSSADAPLTWQQTAGVPVVITAGSADPVTFIAPAPRNATTLTEQVSDGVLSDTMQVSVLPWNEWVMTPTAGLQPVRIKTAT